MGVVGIGTVGVSAEMVLGGEQRVAEVASVSVLSGLLPELWLLPVLSLLSLAMLSLLLSKTAAAASFHVGIGALANDAVGALGCVLGLCIVLSGLLPEL